MNIILIFTGGGIGAVLRHLISSVLAKPNAEFPIAILAVNILGSFLIGLFAGLGKGVVESGMNLHMFFVIGILGGFTTFSAFSMEALTLLNQGKTMMALGYVLASVILSVLAAYIGLILTR